MDNLNRAEYEAVSLFITTVIKVGSDFDEPTKEILSTKLDNLLSSYYEDDSEELLNNIRDTREFVEALDC